MNALASIALVLAVARSQPGADPVIACRAAHGDQPPAHIACLEDALRAGRPAMPPAEAPLAAAAAPAATPPAEAVPAEPTGLGAEQARARKRTDNDTRQATTVKITSLTYNWQGRGIFRMEGGQVWIETEASPVTQRLVPGQQYTARIEQGRVGGYRLYADGVRRMFKVERIE